MINKIFYSGKAKISLLLVSTLFLFSCVQKPTESKILGLPSYIVEMLSSNLALVDKKHDNKIIGWLLKTQVNEPLDTDKYWKTAKHLWIISDKGYFTEFVGRYSETSSEPLYGLTEKFYLNKDKKIGNDYMLASYDQDSTKGWMFLTKVLVPNLKEGFYPFAVKVVFSDDTEHYFYRKNIDVHSEPAEDSSTYDFYNAYGTHPGHNAWSLQPSKSESPTKTVFSVIEITKDEFENAIGFPNLGGLEVKGKRRSDVHIFDMSKPKLHRDLGAYTVALT